MAKREHTLSLARVNEVLDYDPKTGVFTRRTTVGRYKAGTTAGTLVDGYVVIMVDGALVKAHRLAWFVRKGEWPPDQMDHINGNRKDNRIHNLRLCTARGNSFNATIRKTNRSGYKGVSWKSQNNKWVVQIQVDRKKVHVGYFNCVKEAASAYNDAAIKQFGEFAKLNRVE